ncbi:MAG TPA: tetratricopeptide repeat protein, partial [Rubricoccaceae bacterium]
VAPPADAPTAGPPPHRPAESASQALDALLASDRPPSLAGRYAQPYAAPAPAVPPAAPTPALPPEPPTPAPPTRKRGRMVVLVAVVLLGAAAVLAYLRFGPSRLEQEAMDAISRGDLVTPVRVNAYDYAQRLALQRPGSGAAERVGRAAFPHLIQAVDDVYARFYATSDVSRAEWERTSRMTAWAAEIAPDDAHVRARAAYAEARLAALSGDAGRARDGYEAAAEAWPEWALPPNSLGRLLADARRTGDAEAQYRRAARLDPEWPFPLSNLGSLYLREERYDDAADVLGRAVRLDPARPFTHALYARALAGQGQYADAAAQAEDALGRDPTGEAGFDAAALRRDAAQWTLLDQGVEDWDGDGVVEPENDALDEGEDVIGDGEVIDEPDFSM